MLRAPKIYIDVALTPIACAAPGCVRIVPDGDVVHMRAIEGTACAEPLCSPCAAAAIEDMRLRTRIALHATRASHSTP